MTVGRRLMLSLITLIACSAVLGASGLVGVLSLSRHYNAAEEQYRELRSLYEIGHRAASVRQLLNAGAPAEAMRPHLAAAMQEADKLSIGSLDEGRRTIRANLERAFTKLDGGSNSARLQPDVNRCLADVASLAAATEQGIVQNQREATTGFQAVLGAIAVVFLATLVIGAAVGISQYRALMRPIRALDGAVERLSTIRFDTRVQEKGDREFRRLIRRFNQMTGAIEEQHAAVRQQVETRTRQLVRSEQLASVGYLAAGLAHEINNPLGIIAGFAQTSLRRLNNARDPGEQAEAVRKAQEALQIVHEEAFRCRDIAVQLLRMAQPIEGAPQEVSLLSLTRKAVDLIHRLPVARGREVDLRCDAPTGQLVCRGHPTQLLQVLINLLTNALEACAPACGRVELSLERLGDKAVIAVTDNGRGMNEETLTHAFDPFFTDKPRRGLNGCGLGLSVSHSIIQRHNGRLYAHSEGRDRGSIFTIELPAAHAA